MAISQLDSPSNPKLILSETKNKGRPKKAREERIPKNLRLTIISSKRFSKIFLALLTLIEG